MGDHHLLQLPLITTTSTTSSTTGNDKDCDINTTLSVSPYGIIIRLVSVFFIALISIWANYEASKGFEITVINDTADTPAGRRFNLLFVSNDKITRIVLTTSEFAENILYPTESYAKKPITRVTVKLVGRNLTHPVVINSITEEDFELQINPSLMEERNVDKAIVSAVQRGMARIWIWNGVYGAPDRALIDGIEEYISIFAEFSGRPLSHSGNSATVELPGSDSMCWKDKNPVAVANFLNYCEGKKSGFIGRLNQAMRDNWNERMVDDALGMPAQQLCSSYHFSFAVVNSLSSSLSHVS
ncbi:Uncharacterized protein family [Macleaya cordata]|uniref:Uncharacterized protein family n=1 Tax=Macleaya cordata TaxID=56857 RepID=A0A200PT95_MACCD|nr:Uncharacterized protein family [Macleaya cordata]